MSAQSLRLSTAEARVVHDVGAAITVELQPLPSLFELASEWRALEERADGSFFVGWSWIGCWIEALRGTVELLVLRARLNGRTVGLGVFATHLERRHRIITSHTLRLHATGRPELDILMIECNGLLIDRELHAPVRRRMLAHLLQRESAWDELVLDGMSDAECLSHANERTAVRSASHANHYVDLAAVRAAPGGYLSLLGSKTRSRIRRSLKEYESLGELKLQCASDTTQALAFLEGLKTFHQSYWSARGEPGAFANAFFERFHRQLVRSAFARGEIQMFAVDAGARRVGYIYNFVQRGHIYNYQSGLDYQVCEKHNRPGLVAHMLAVEFSARCGHRVYDYLAGDSEYKQALGTAVREMSWVTVQRDRVRFRIEGAGRMLLNRARRLRRAALRRSATRNLTTQSQAPPSSD
ncbi:MAG TPA: GNAT family N-acetyltransferase [Steroidobacteraceae bacterium]|nr:GNAT family N-acetyltransferase [Steroidobacteraceae bacterium]